MNLIEIDENNRIILCINIVTKDGTQQELIKFQLDTGADFSTISYEDLKKLDYDINDIKEKMKYSGICQTATKESSKCYSIELMIVNVLGQVMPKGLKIPIICLSHTNVNPPMSMSYCKKCALVGEKDKGFSSLIGRDILSCFNIEINNEKEKPEVTLKRITDMTKRNKRYDKCQMYSIETYNDFEYKNFDV